MQTHYFANKGPSSQGYGFSSSHYGCESWTIKKAEHWRIDAFELWCWRRLLIAPWTARRSNQSILKEISPGFHWKDWCWSWNANTLATWWEELTHWKRPWCWERLGAGGEGDDRGWDGWMASPTPGVHSDSYPSSQWCHPAISYSVVPFSSCPQPLPASESFPMSQVFAWGGQSIGVSALASFLPKKSQGWSPLEWTGSISLQSKGLSRVFSNTTIWKHQFFSAQPSSQSNSHIHTWPQEKP